MDDSELCYKFTTLMVDDNSPEMLLASLRRIGVGYIRDAIHNDRGSEVFEYLPALLTTLQLLNACAEFKAKEARISAGDFDKS